MSAEHATLARLAQVPQILDILVNSSQITKDQQNKVILAFKNSDYPEYQQYKGKFAGQIAVEMGYVNKEQVDAGLREQSKLIAKAATDDLQDIVSGKSLTSPHYWQPHWGNGGKVNNIGTVTIDSAASAAANVSKLIVLLAKDKPESFDIAQEGAIAAKNLTDYILKGSSDRCPGNKLAANWLDQARETLRNVAKDEPNLNKYIENRFTEIGRGVYLAQIREANPSQQIRSV